MIPEQVWSLETGTVSLSAGENHTCAVTSAGELKCWGLNGNGQLGNGATNPLSFPNEVWGLDKDVVAVSAGTGHTCSLTAKGKVMCWGLNTSGQIGDGTQANRLVPTQVAGLESGAIAVTAGANHNCILTAAGEIKCWGQNTQGQLGNGTTTASTIPVLVKGIDPGAIAVSAGTAHTCAFMADGKAMCWGQNTNGRLGIGSTTASHEPAQVVNLTADADVVAIAAGNAHSCAISLVEGLVCWGYNNYGQLGNGTTTASNVPVVAASVW